MLIVQNFREWREKPRFFYSSWEFSTVFWEVSLYQGNGYREIYSFNSNRILRGVILRIIKMHRENSIWCYQFRALFIRVSGIKVSFIGRLAYTPLELKDWYIKASHYSEVGLSSLTGV